MTSQEVVAGVPGQLSAVLRTPGVIGVPERQEASSGLGSALRHDQTISSEISGVKPVPENTKESTSFFDKVGTSVHGNDGNRSPVVSSGVQEGTGGASRGPGTAPGNFASSNWPTSGVVESTLPYQTPPGVTRLPQRQGNASRDKGRSSGQSVMVTSGDDSSHPGVGRLPNDLPAGRPRVPSHREHDNDTVLGNVYKKRLYQARNVGPYAGKRDIKSRTLKITCARSAVPYRSIHILDAIREHMDLSRVEAISTHGRNFEFFVTFEDTNAMLVLMTYDISVGGQIVRMETLDKQDVLIRVHWLPYWCDIAAVVRGLESYGTIIKVLHETIQENDHEAQHIRTSVRRIILRCNPSDLDKIPHTISIDGNLVLLTVKGRPPICLKCGESGHIRSKCKAEQCRHCSSYAHTSEECSVANSYAARVRGNRQSAPDEGRVDPQELMDDGDAGAFQVHQSGGSRASPIPSKPLSKDDKIPSLSDYPILPLSLSQSKSQSEKAGENDPERMFEASSAAPIRGITDISPPNPYVYQVPNKRKRRKRLPSPSRSSPIQGTEVSNPFQPLVGSGESLDDYSVDMELTTPWEEKTTGGDPPDSIMEMLSPSSQLQDLDL